MPLVDAKCPNCGQPLKVDNTKDAAVCEFCGSAFIVEKAIHNININNTVNVGSGSVVNVYHENLNEDEFGFDEKTVEYLSFTKKQKAFEITPLIGGILLSVVAIISFVFYLLNDGWRILSHTGNFDAHYGHLNTDSMIVLKLLSLIFLLIVCGMICFVLYTLINSKKCMFTKVSPDRIKKLFFNTKRKILLYNNISAVDSFTQMMSSGKYRSFNVVAFLFPYFWFAKKKMFLQQFLIALTYYAFAIMFATAFSWLDFIMVLVAYVILHMLTGLFSNYAYMQQLEKIYQKSKVINGSLADQYLSKQNQNTIIFIVISIIVLGAVGIGVYLTVYIGSLSIAVNNSFLTGLFI